MERPVRDALAHLHDLPHLQTHPLGDLRGKALQRALLEAIDELRGHATGEAVGRVQRLLALRYAEALDSRAVAARLAISIGEYYREHGRGVRAVGSILRERGAQGTPSWSRAGSTAPRLPGGTPLPRPLTSFVGRERELAEVEQLLATTRLPTLTGSGGVGKTRVAVAAARALASAFADGAEWVDLAPLADPALVPETVAAAVGAHGARGRPPVDVLLRALRDRRGLLLLDNCEHLADPVARLAEALLQGCPGLTLVATSREPLAVAAEVTWRV